MNIFIKNLLTVVFLTIGFFFFSGSSSAEACQIVSAATRPNGIINNYSDVTGGRPFIYLDVQTQNCNTNPSQILEIKFFAEPISGFPVDHIQTIKVEVGTTGNLSSQSDFKTPLSDFSIPIYLGEQGNGSDSGSNYCRLNGSTDSICKLFVKFFDLNNNNGNSNPIYSLGQLGGPFPLTYTCQNFCDVSWQLGCPVGAGIAPNPLPYGIPNICSTDNVTLNVTGEVNLPNSGPSATEYSTEPLAPLPGFTGNPNLGQWLESLFTILIVIAGILALIMIIVGGITYITSESFGGKGQGKAYIINAIIGLVLALGAWVILNTINPNLAEDLNISIPTASLSIGDADYFSSSPLTNSSGTLTGSGPLPNIGLVCPMSGGVSAVPQIIDSFVNKTTYRWGAKGGPLPAGGQFPLSPNEQSGSPYMCEGAECRSFCPDNSVCLDCSGFVNQVRRCSGLPTFSGTASMVSSPSAVPIQMSNLSSNGQSITIEGSEYTFQPGDILVWNGHVVVYYGGGQIAESAGALTTNTNIKKSALASYSGRNKITHLIKVNP